MSTIHIREARVEDFPKVFDMIKKFAAFQNSSHKIIVSLEEMLDARDIFYCFVAETDDGRITGYTTCFQAYYTWTGRAVYLDDLFVLEEFRGMKIGSKLMEEVFALARKKKCSKVRWQVSDWNNKAIEFYKSLGATIDGTELNCDLISHTP